MAKSLVELVIGAFPELEGKTLFHEGVWLQNDSDGSGDYIAKWEYSQPIAETLKQYQK